METTNIEQQVILVTEQDMEIGVMEKLAAHREGELHRAFSVFIFDNNGNILLQKRAKEKYHSGGLWTNACCGHPEPKDIMEEKVNQRLLEEMGIKCNLRFGFKFLYITVVDNDLMENELDYIYFGNYSEQPAINPAEASAWRYVAPDSLREEMKTNPEYFTEWFKLLFEKAIDFYNNNKTDGLN